MVKSAQRSGLGQNLHFRIDPAEAAAGGVGEREISVDECVAGTSGTIFDGEAAMAQGQPVAEFSDQLASVLGGVGIGDSVVEMNLDFSPAGMAVIGEHIEQALVVLLGGVEVRVDKRTAIGISPAGRPLWDIRAPTTPPGVPAPNEGRASGRLREQCPVQNDRLGQR